MSEQQQDVTQDPRILEISAGTGEPPEAILAYAVMVAALQGISLDESLNVGLSTLHEVQAELRGATFV